MAEAISPVIISASRSTDIPAFYADWFFTRLQAGYSAWTNPFNGVKTYVSYKNTRFIVFWSKNPRPLLPYLDMLKEKGIGCYLQYTLNDYEKEGLETGVPPLAQRIDTFKRFSDKLGKEAVIWRFDPMILTDGISEDALLSKVEYIGNQLRDYTEKLVFSYADIGSYKRVKHNLMNNGIAYQEWDMKRMEVFAAGLSAMNKANGWNFTLATCGEKISLEKYGIAHNRCIDGDLIVRLAWKDCELMKHMNVTIHKMAGNTLFGEQALPAHAVPLPENNYFISIHRKDPGQRAFCGCMASKDIGEYNTCPHLCEYCYANVSKQAAMDNWKRHIGNKQSDTITGK